MSKCPKCEEDEQKQSSGSAAHYTVADLRDLEMRKVGHVFMAVEHSLLKWPPKKSADLLLDTAATSHMFCTWDFFDLCAPFHTNFDDTVTAANGHEVPVARIGSVQ